MIREQQIQSVIDSLPGIGPGGYGDTDRDWQFDKIAWAATWLESNFDPLTRSNPHVSSYGVKHAVEDALMAVDSDLQGWFGSGEAAVAARLAGFPVDCDGDQFLSNYRIGISLREYRIARRTLRALRDAQTHGGW